MATVTDLTFEQLNDAAIADSNIGEAIFSYASGVITLDLEKLTGNTFTGLTNSGVLEAMYKIRKLAGEAQITVNEEEATTAEEELTSFPSFTFGLPSSEGLVEVTQVTTFNIPLGINTIIGTN